MHLSFVISDMKLDKKTQNLRALALFKKRKTVRSIDLTRATGATRPSARVFDLRAEGHIIETAKTRDRHGFQPYTYKGRRRVDNELGMKRKR